MHFFLLFCRMYRVWENHLNWLSIMTPRNLVSLTSDVQVPLITMPSIHRGEIFGAKNTKLVLTIFSDNWFAFSQACIFAISSFIWWLTSLRSLPVQNRFVSSAKRIGMKSLDTLCRSFIYTRKSRGLRMEPWGTAHFSNLYSDSYHVLHTSAVCLIRYCYLPYQTLYGNLRIHPLHNFHCPMQSASFHWE